MDGIAAKVAEEVLVFFEHRDLDTLFGKKIGEHYARRAAADDATGGLQNF
jgi:hypothetical protein